MPVISPGASRTDTVFRSVLTPGDRRLARERRTSDAALHDLALDQVLDRLIKRAPAAADAFRTLCADEAEVSYRQEVFAALDDDPLRNGVKAFLQEMDRSDVADAGAAHAHYPFEGELWRLEAVRRYVGAVTGLVDCLSGSASAAGSVALTGLADHLAAYRASAEFAQLEREAQGCRDELDALDYNVLIRGGKVIVAPTDGEDDLREAVLDTFARFRSGDPEFAAETFRDPGLDHVQAWVLEKAALVHPGPFERLRRFTASTESYRDEIVQQFAAEVWFYLAWLEHIAPLQAAGLPFCSPTVSAGTKELDARDTFDVALATRLAADGEPVVRNDIRLTAGERVIIVSGPNQGGKSTTARAFGQLHHLAGIGCPVPGRQVRVFLCDRVLTAFEREEQLDELEGRLGAEIQRMHEILAQATGNCVLVLNEVFSSTALQDARILTRDVLHRILDVDALAICVTFIDELSRLDERTVSMVSTVDPHDAAVRTFRVERREADGRAYARALAARHGLTGPQITERMSARKGQKR